MPAQAPFLTAEWRHLAMLNWRVDPELLLPHVPAGTELDLFEGHAYVSIVGFLFLNTRVRGLAIPWHRDFEELNLRAYVVRHEGGERRRGVFFVKELVPRWAIATVARLFYGERYVSLPMSHRLDAGSADEGTRSFELTWGTGPAACRLALETEGAPFEPGATSEEAFIAEHYWGYASGRRGTMEYRVEHPSWRVQRARSTVLEGDLAALYGEELAAPLRRAPDSAFLAEGSAVSVYPGARLES